LCGGGKPLLIKESPVWLLVEDMAKKRNEGDGSR
jgi:hypothetical protein